MPLLSKCAGAKDHAWVGGRPRVNGGKEKAGKKTCGQLQDRERVRRGRLTE